MIPAEGVYAGRVTLAAHEDALLEKGESLPAVFSIGQARTFGDEYPLLIEAHLLDKVLPEMTGQWMAMDFVRHLRHQHRFGSSEALVRQIEQDCQQARAVLKEPPEGEANE